MMKLLLTNDDGVDAPGLQALFAAATLLGRPVVVAPTETLSGCSHRVTTNQPLRLLPCGVDRYALAGTPADCVRVALHQVLREPTWVLSGINAGGNLGADVHHSGTVAAVREAVLHGVPGIAVSQYIKRGLTLDWQTAAGWVTPILRDIMRRTTAPGTFWNINLPHLEPDAPMPEVVYCPLDSAPLPLSFRQEGDLLHYDGDYHGRQRIAGSDVDICFRGKIAVTEISLYQ